MTWQSMPRKKEIWLDSSTIRAMYTTVPHLDTTLATEIFAPTRARSKSLFASLLCVDSNDSLFVLIFLLLNPQPNCYPRVVVVNNKKRMVIYSRRAISPVCNLKHRKEYSCKAHAHAPILIFVGRRVDLRLQISS